MAKASVMWTVLPAGRVNGGDRLLNVSVLVAPRLTPQVVDERQLSAFPDFLNWPKTVAEATFALRINGVLHELGQQNELQPELWDKLFSAETPVSGFVFADMSRVNLRSFPVRHVLGFLRRYYGRLAVQSASNLPSLLPWDGAHPDLKEMVGELGMRTRKIPLGHGMLELPEPGFGRFYDKEAKGLDRIQRAQVFGPDSQYNRKIDGPGGEQGGASASVRALPPDWTNPRPGGPNAPIQPGPAAQVMDQFRSQTEYAMWQADRFYRRVPATEEEQRMRRPDFSAVPPPPKQPEMDFHRIVASFGDHPALLRQLGLLLDFRVKAEAVNALVAAGGGTGDGILQLEVKWPRATGFDDGRPRTAFRADKQRFYTRPRGGDSARGLLKLEHAHDGWGVAERKTRSPFDLFQLDPDGAALKTVGFTVTAQGLVTKHLDRKLPDGGVTYTTGDRQGVAALRSGGLGVSRHGRAQTVALNAAAAATRNARVASGAAQDVLYFAEDVHRGWRVDVSPVEDEVNPGKWFSLNARTGSYRLQKTDEKLDLPPDEGHVAGASTTRSVDAAADPDDHYLHETMFRWSGWSLSAPRAGRAIRARKVEGTELQAEEPADVSDEAQGGNGLVVSFSATKGTLPRLRFGQLYRMRAREVDVAGNSLLLDDPTLEPLEQASDAVGYWRFEPVDPPALVQKHRVSEGESGERMVIRSNWDLSTDDYPASADFAAAIALPASADFAYPVVNERHFAPPKAAQMLCETHGSFDPFFGNPAEIKKGYEIAAREAGTLFDGAELVTPVKLTEVAKTPELPPRLPSEDNPVGDRLVGGQYIIHPEEQLLTPYLPDPAAAGVALRAAPGHQLPGVDQEMDLGPSCIVRRAPNQELVLLVAHAKRWPDSFGFRLILVERKAAIGSLPCNEQFDSPGRPKWDEDARTLTLFVSKGRIVRLNFASFVAPREIGKFGIPMWTTDAGGREFATRMAVLGCNWLVTPFRPLVLVHATQQPVCEPELIKLHAGRQPGWQHAELKSVVDLHGPSSGKFEIEAVWSEWVDDISRPRPERVERKGQLGEILLAENHVNQFELKEAVDAMIFDPQRPRARADRHEFGDTRFRLIEYRARATTRFREYLPEALYVQTDKVTRLGPPAQGSRYIVGADDDAGAPVLPDSAGPVNRTAIPATVAPDDPRLLYVVPSFRWQSSGTATNRTITRIGNGLRVWLDRPWFTSGDGELLGVVIHADGGNFTDIPQALQPYVTQWGRDPLWETVVPKSRTRVTDFPASVWHENHVLTERPGDPPVTIVGHRVHFDEARGLWYVDIELDAGATYMPFVRLALVRYQPNALGGRKISNVVLAEFSQVLPRRQAKLVRNGAVATLTLNGRAPASGPMKFDRDSAFQDISLLQGIQELGRNRVELVHQTRDPDTDSDLAWSEGTLLASSLTGPDVPGPGPGPGPFPIAQAAGVKAVRARDSARIVEPRAGGKVSLPSVFERPGDILERFPSFGDPEIFEATVTLPAGSRPARLMLREYERYYSDRTVPERAAGAVRRRRVVEERLVYAAIFEL
ncbi:hypothetical protein [Sandaracinobacteroides hominis]|uniref:hypothetical protein n=1 Tax=Sandaracinobacteroides hominis TaxID=2780086 RepID=UPI0018F2B6EA|nr:hypothetical protein [Sandaracinobacteroides hominis]